MVHRQREQAPGKLSGAIVALCFALQPFAYPVHFALMHHSHATPDGIAENHGGHAHSSSTHHHDHHHHKHHHEHAHHSGTEPNHDGDPGHPDDDHAEFLPDLAITPAPVVFIALALLPTPIKLIEPGSLFKAATPCESPPPRPPPRLVASPRAPPFVA
ncbi:MAG: hypothetical protein VYC32_07345 [Planctomycetota bacterium]|nr:hypothetical protein [Planctomycetota bacterium]